MENNNIYNIEEKIKNLKEWNDERKNIKPILDVAVEYHNKARREAYWKNYEKASEFFKLAIESYKSALKLNPRYYLQDVMDRVDSVIEEHMNNIFNIKVSGDSLMTEQGISRFVEFINNLNPEEKKYIDQYEVALTYFKIGEMYFADGNLDRAYEFFNDTVNLRCSRSFLNRDAYSRIGQILIDKKRFKEALLSFVSALSFERGNIDVVNYIDMCLNELNIAEHRLKFLSAAPNEARKLIMEVL